MKRLGCRVLLSSDCHDKRFLDCHFEQSMQLIADCGFDEIVVNTPRGFESISIRV